MSLSNACSKGVHPRLCGAKAMPSEMSVHTRGSSPRSRGKGDSPEKRYDPAGFMPAFAGRSLYRNMQSAISAGFIPAYAGQRNYPVTDCSSVRVHPRVRGAKFGITCVAFASMGASPLTRGKGRSPRNLRPIMGVIPAYAGAIVSSPIPYPPFLPIPLVSVS